MANPIQIKRSLASTAPSSLLEGEFAYTFGNNKLYIGAPLGTIRDITQLWKDYTDTAITNLVNGADGAYDTLKELADLIAADEGGIAALTTTVAGKLTIASNLSDLASVSTARTNLGLGTMATQNASAVAITGGTIDNVTIDGGTF